MCCSPCSPNKGDSKQAIQDKALEDGEDYEYIPIHPLDPGDPGDHSTSRKKGGPAAPDALLHELKQMPT